METEDPLTGGCYCGRVRYVVTARPVLKAQCHCRACQHISGGGPNYFMLIPPEGFAYTEGTPAQFTRPDLEHPVTRDFCAHCGTHLVTRRPGLAQLVLKVGTLDDPSVYGAPQMAVFAEEMAAFHLIPEGIPAFPKLPERR